MYPHVFDFEIPWQWWNEKSCLSFLKNIFSRKKDSVHLFIFLKENVTHFNISWRYFLSEVWIYGGVADARAATIAVIVQLAAELGAWTHIAGRSILLCIPPGTISVSEVFPVWEVRPPLKIWLHINYTELIRSFTSSVRLERSSMKPLSSRMMPKIRNCF